MRMMEHASLALKDAYLPNLVSGTWTATMNLTEPQAGSDLAQVRTRAASHEYGSYRITGSKIFITCGEHDWAENIIHLVLARLPDAPAGTKGISLFLVPKFLPDGFRNDVRCTGIEHKLGIHGSPTCSMIYGDNGGAVGWLIGAPNQGLACMFTMMNRARVATALQGVAIAERAYQRARSFAEDRKQGRTFGAPPSEISAIVVHPDVQMMLRTMRSLTCAPALWCMPQRRPRTGRSAAMTRQHRTRRICSRQSPKRLPLSWGGRRFVKCSDAWRHGVYRGNRGGAAFARYSDCADLRGHQRDSGD
jgi:butyryl-CoA dehydrogenase